MLRPTLPSLLVVVTLSLFSHCIVAASPAQSLPQKTVSGSDAGSVYFSDYKPREPKRLNDLPPLIRRKLHAHLVERLGAGFASRLTLKGGQIVDVAEFYRVESGAHDYKWKIFSYNLFFAFSMHEKGISEYLSGIWLDQNGDVIQEISLPPIRRFPLKQEFISLRQAYDTAANLGFDIRRTTAELRYDGNIQSIVYHLQQPTRSFTAGSFTYGVRYRFIDIDAHSGRVLRIKSEDWYE